MLRHAKSSWETDDDDHERPLNQRGLRDAPRMGALVRKERLLPDRIFSSTAARARSTTELVVEASGYDGPIEYTRDLYQAEPKEIVQILRAIDDAPARAMIVGHNPGLEEFIEAMTGEFHELPTAALAHLEIPIDRWRDLTWDGNTTVVQVYKPKEL